MDDHDLPLTLKEMSAFNPRLFVPRRHRCPGGPGLFRIKNHWFLFHFCLMEFKLHRQKHPHLHGFFTPARRFEQPLFHCLSGREIKLTEAGGFFDEHFTYVSIFQHSDS